jgi:hypothetical protein
MNANAAVFAFQHKTLAEEEPVCKLAYNLPNLSVYASDGAVVRGVPGTWRPGELPKNWEEIRASFWGRRVDNAPPVFRLGDFTYFTRFCALAQALELARPEASTDGGAGTTAPPPPADGAAS